MDLKTEPRVKRAYKPRQPKPDPSAPLVAELITLIRETNKQQHEVLASAMQAQTMQAEMLKTWMSMFTPGTTTKSTNELDREAIRNNAEMDSEWEPMDPIDFNRPLL